MTDELTRIENASIRKFLNSVSSQGYFRGRVLDYGCGMQPYRKLVERKGGIYTGLDLEKNPSNQYGDVNPELAEHRRWAYGDQWDTILCTQVLQFMPGYEGFIRQLGYTLGAWGDEFSGSAPEGPRHLVLTYPTNWPEVEETDLHRFTKAGMEKILYESGFTVIRHDRRATFHQHGYEWAFGYGVVARA